MALRVALLGIYHESNTFIPGHTGTSDFKNGHWLHGEDIRAEYQQAYHEIGGMLEVMTLQGIETVPVMFAEATPGGMVDEETCNVLFQTMFDELEAVLPVDGCLVVPHGAGVSENYADMDGEWLSRLRERLGPNIPVIGTLDPHANVSGKMIRATNALVAYKTNPHIDQRETGKEAAMIMAGTLKGIIKPVQYFMQLPIAISIEQQYTGAEPCLGLFAYANNLLQYAGVLSTSVILGFPYADVYEMGSSFILVSDGRTSEAEQALSDMLCYVEANKPSFTGEKKSISQVLPMLDQFPKPVLLLDMGDNIGGGSSGKSTYLLDALENQSFRTFISICDPAAVQSVIHHDLGDSFLLSFGRSQESHGKPFQGEVTLLSVVSGQFSEKNPRHGGQVNFDMGKTVVVRTENGNTVMLTSLRVPPFSLEQLLSAGISPEDFDVIVAKGVNAPIAAYSPVCKTIVQIDTPGVTRADMKLFDYRNRRKPLFPFENQTEQ